MSFVNGVGLQCGLAYFRLVAFLAAGLSATAHPMGNFSVNRWLELTPDGAGAGVRYVVVFAEQPSYELKRAGKDGCGGAEAWARNWALAPAATVRIASCRAVESEGAAGLPVVRVEASFRIDGAAGTLDFVDRNFQGLPGWREITIRPGAGIALIRASHPAEDRSHELREFPAPAPYDAHARVSWRTGAQDAATVMERVDQPAAPGGQAAAPAPAAATVGNDPLSRLLGRKDLSLGVILMGLVVAFGFGAMHAMSPGHGKTIVAAYLVGARGTLRHAVLLGGMVTFTHTASVFLLGLGTLLLSRYVVPDRIYPWLGAVSGLSIVAVGGTLLWRRVRHMLDHRMNRPHHHHHHSHGHGHGHGHHHHVEGDVSVGGLIALGASGGLVPCPSALVLLLTSVALGRVGLGLVLLVSFSLGLAAVLMAIGAMVLYAKSWLPDTEKTSRHAAFRYVPVISAAVIVAVGLLMTAVSLGWVRPVAGI